MEFNLEIRKKQLESLRQYVRSSEDNVKAVFQSLGWTVPKTLEKEDIKILCPLNKNHLISRKTYDKHLEMCRLKLAGYEGNEEYLSEPPDKADCSIKLANAKKIEILGSARGNRSDFRAAWNGRDLDPITSDRLTSTFSVDERLTLYDYSIKHTEAPPKPEEFTLIVSDSKEKKELSERDRQTLERDAKRRRVKYKSVHTSKKSQTEIMREMIDNQMALYADWIKQKWEQERKEKEKLKKLAKEKMKKNATTDHNFPQDNQYQYIGTTYDQNVSTPNIAQWNSQSLAYPVAYGGQYYSAVQTNNQGVITDWSHLYQGGIETDYYTTSGQYHPEEGEYIEPIRSSIDSSTRVAYENTSQLSALSANASNVYVNPSGEAEAVVDNRKVRSRLKEAPPKRYEEDTHEKLKLLLKDAPRHEKVPRKSLHSHEKGTERRH